MTWLKSWIESTPEGALRRERLWKGLLLLAAIIGTALLVALFMPLS
jgi:hypothetical protein